MARIELPGPAPRVVSLTSVASHFVRALGAEDTLVGVDAASARVPGLEDLPVVDPASAAQLGPDLVLLPAPAPGDPPLEALRETGAELVEFAPHDLEDVFSLCRRVGPRLVGAARAQAFEMELARPLALIGGASFGQARPRVVGLVDLDPPVLAGGHSFETDLIEIAGASSVTHGGVEPRLEISADAWSRLAPDLVLVFTRDAPTDAQQRAALEALPVLAPVTFFAVDPLFWLREPAETAQRLRAVIEPLSRQLEARR